MNCKSPLIHFSLKNTMWNCKGWYVTLRSPLSDHFTQMSQMPTHCTVLNFSRFPSQLYIHDIEFEKKSSLNESNENCHITVSMHCRYIFQCWPTPVSVSRKNIASKDESVDPGWSNCCCGPGVWWPHPKYNPYWICGLHCPHHRPQTQHHHGQR